MHSVKPYRVNKLWIIYSLCSVFHEGVEEAEGNLKKLKFTSKHLIPRRRMRSTMLRRAAGFTPFGGSATKRRASEGQPAKRLAVLSGAGRNNM